MKVKIEDQVYDSNDTPILLILSDQDKENIRNMHENAIKFCSYPDDYNVDKLLDFMKNMELPELRKPKKSISQNKEAIDRISKEIYFSKHDLEEFLLYQSHWEDKGICCVRLIDSINNIYRIYDEETDVFVDDETYKVVDDDGNLPFYLVSSKRKYLDDYFYGSILIPLKYDRFWKIDYSIE